MIDWRRGGWTGSVNGWTRKEVREQLRENPVARRVRHGPTNRLMRRLFGFGTFGGFIGSYVVVNASFVVAEALFAWLVPNYLPQWSTFGEQSAAELSSLIMNISSYLLGAQISLLGVISLALALVTLIAQREGSSTDVQVYYHESFSFELVASCVALAAVLCVQLLWPAQVLLQLTGLGGGIEIFKLGLLGVHLVWLLINLAAVAFFIATTFRFVQQSTRELLRERYTANVVLPRDLTERLRHQLYASASQELLGPVDPNGRDEQPSVMFGFELGEPRNVEIQTHFGRPKALLDVRMTWVRWVLRRWSKRCLDDALEQPASGIAGLGRQAPIIWFSPHIDQALTGQVAWCRRRGGVPLTALERFVLRHAFVFRRPRDAR